MKPRVFLQKFNTNNACRAHLELVRWPTRVCVGSSGYPLGLVTAGHFQMLLMSHPTTESNKRESKIYE